MDTPPPAALLVARLAADRIRLPVASLVLAASYGERELADELAGRPHPTRAIPVPPPDSSKSIYLEEVPLAAPVGRQTAPVPPMDGLTVVLGRPGRLDLAAGTYLSERHLHRLSSRVDFNDALLDLLGLRVFVAAERRLTRASAVVEGRIADLRLQRAQLVSRLALTSDERAQRLAAVLRAERPNLDEAAAILREPSGGEELHSGLGVLELLVSAARSIIDGTPDLAISVHDGGEAAHRGQVESDSSWWQLRVAVRAWLGAARRRIADELELARLAAARAWLRRTIDQLRAQRLAALGVTIPTDSPSPAALRSCGLATFLARAGAAAGPSRYVVLDRPASGASPAEAVDVVRDLATLARNRQVVVFASQDDRICTTIRRLHVAATVVDAGLCVPAGAG